MEHKKEVSFNFLFLLAFSVLNIFLVYVSLWYLILTFGILLILILKKIKYTYILIFIVSSFIPLDISFLIGKYNVFNHLANWIDDFIHFSLRNFLISFIKNNYSLTDSNIIELLIFNIKTNSGKYIYQLMINMSIVHLIVISGLHLSIIAWINQKIFKRTPKVCFTINLLLITFMCYLLNFSISTLRVLFCLTIAFVFKKRKPNKFDAVSISGFISVCINPFGAINLGFLMSYLCTVTIIYINQFKLPNFWIQFLLTNLCAFIVSLPFVLQINSKISLFVVINSFIFNYFIIFIFIAVLIFVWIPFLINLIHSLINLMVNVIVAFNYLNIQINLIRWNHLIVNLYLSVLLISYYVFNLTKSKSASNSEKISY